MPWTDAFDNETRAYAASKGWDKLSDTDAVQTVFRSYRELERMRPEPAPKTAGEYDLSSLRNADGSAPDAELLDMVRDMAFELKLPLSSAKQLGERLIKVGTDAENVAAADAAQALKNGETALKGKWGAEFDKNSDLALKAFNALGLPKEVVDSMVTAAGLDKVYAVGHELGTRMGEAAFHQGGKDVGDKSEPLTRMSAIAERNRLMADRQFYEKFMSGDKEAKEHFDKVTAAILGTPDNWEAPPVNFGRTIENPGGPRGSEDQK